MPIKARLETLAQLSQEDKSALKAIYRHRCLDEALLQKFFYGREDDGQNGFTLKRIQWFIQQELLGIDEFGDGHCVFYLTNRGLQTVRELYDCPMYVIDKKTGNKVYDVTAKQLQPANKLLDHQLHLNELSLDIETRCGLPDGCYKDSKFASDFTYAQPDGVFELPGFDLFIEMDMAHERVADLCEKWEHYRNYRSSREYYLRRDKRIIVLFATENIKRSLAYRRSKVLESLSRSVFDLIGETFDCYIGPSSEMAAVAERLISPQSGQEAFERLGMFLQEQMGFSFARPNAIREACGESYLYMRQLNEQKRPLVRDGRPQNFFMENYLDRPASVLRRIVTFGRTSSVLTPSMGRTVPLLVVVPDELSIYQDLAAVGGLGVQEVFFTTVKRLNERLFPEAVFQFDQLGNRYHFTDYSYQTRVHEKKGG